MQRWFAKVTQIAIGVAAFSQIASGQALSKSDKNTLALLDFGGSTASALYGIVKSDLDRKIPADKYEEVAFSVTRTIDQARASSKLAQAPFTLIGATLTTASLVDPEPVSRTVTLVAGYGATKFGEWAGQKVMDQANAQADAILARGLATSKISVADLQRMNPEDFSNSIENMLVGDKKLAELLKDSPQSLERIKAHAQDLRDTAGLATLKNVQGIKGDTAKIAEDVAAVTEKVGKLTTTLSNGLRDVENGMTALNASVVKQGKDIEALQKAVEGNSGAIHALAQVSSQSWTVSQKLAALDAGLFSDMTKPQQEALRTALQSQQRTENVVADLQKTAATLSGLATIASNLGVDPGVVKAAQGGQVVFSAIASYMSGDYLGAAVAASSLLGFGKGASDSNAALMGYLESQFGKINEKLNKIVELQTQTLQAVAAISEQLARMQVQLTSIEREVNVSRITLQALSLVPWEPCDALTNSLNNGDNDASMSKFISISSQPLLKGYLDQCFSQYTRYFDAHVATGDWGYGVLSLAQFPLSSAFALHNDVARMATAVDRAQLAYEANRQFFLKIHGEAAATAPAPYLAALLSPQPNAVAAADRKSRIGRAETALKAYKCGIPDALYQGIERALCQGVLNGSSPQPAIWPVLLSRSLAGPQAPRLIEAGLSVSTWSSFAYTNPTNKQMVYASEVELKGAVKNGLTSGMKAAQKEGRRQLLLQRLEWLAAGYLLQQSVLYGDAIAESVADVLYDPHTRTLVPPADMTSITDPKVDAFRAIQANEVLARNVVLIALRRALLSQDGTVQASAFGYATAMMVGGQACRDDSVGSQYLRTLLPGWKITRAVTGSEKKADPGLNGCMDADTSVQISTGLGVNFAGVFIKLPISQALVLGEFERPAPLRVAQYLVNRLAESRGDLASRSWLPTTVSAADMGFVRQLLASQCLAGTCH